MFDIEITRYLARCRLLSLEHKLSWHFTRYESTRKSPKYQFAKLYQLRLVVENVTYGSHDHKLRKFIHNVTDEVFSCFLKGVGATTQMQVLRSVCKVVYTHYDCKNLFRALGKEDFKHDYFRFPDADEHVPKASLIVAIASYYDQAKRTIETENMEVNFQTEHFGSPLEMAARLGHVQTTEWLLNRMGESSNDQNIKVHALTAAATHGQAHIVAILLKPEAQLNLDIRDVWSCDQFVQNAAKYRHFDIVRMIFETHPRLVDRYRNSVCYFSSMHGEDTMLLEMIKTGINLNEILGTPLSIAAKSNRISTVSLLLDNGALVKSMGKDAFVIAAIHGKLEMIQFMCQRNIHKESRRRLYTAFAGAASNGQLDITRYLARSIDMKRFRRSRYSYQYHALSDAMSGKHYEMVRWLVQECGIDVTKYSANAMTDSPSPIFDAVQLRNMDLMVLLFRLGATPLDLDDPATVASLHIFKPTDLKIESAHKAQQLNRRWKEASELGVSIDDFFDKS